MAQDLNNKLWIIIPAASIFCSTKFNNLPGSNFTVMVEDYEAKRNKKTGIAKSIVDYVMGIFFTGLGLFFVFRGKFRLDFNKQFPPDWLDIVFGVLCVLYGSWRIYRGYKKNYFR